MNTIVSRDNKDRGTVFDADGSPVLHCIEAEIETGRCIVIVTDEYGNVQTDRLGIELERVEVQRPAPLTFRRFP
jgi:hypothetical protein